VDPLVPQQAHSAAPEAQSAAVLEAPVLPELLEAVLELILLPWFLQEA
jgi:hypothetical protein